MKKIPTLFVRDFDSRPAYVTDEVTPGCEWVLAGEGRPTRKYDGTCVKVENGATYNLWVRREVKPNKQAPNGFVAIEHDETTGKTVGWEPWSSSPFAKYIEEARKNYAAVHPLPDSFHSDLPSGTYELIGPKINGNPEQVGHHMFVQHGYMSASDQAEAEDLPHDRDYDDLRWWLQWHDWEGIVFHHPDGRMAKIKRKDFPHE